jgi:hypothetical protein
MKRRRSILLILGALLLVVLAGVVSREPSRNRPALRASDARTPEGAREAGAPAPVRRPAKSAATNPLDRVSAGITAAPAAGPDAFAVRDRNVTAFFDSKGIALALIGVPTPGAGPAERRGWGMRWGVVGAQETPPRPEGELPGRVHSFVGDPSRWQSDQKTYGRIVYDEIKPGVDLVVESRPHSLKYSLHAARGGDLAGLQLRYEGAQELRIDEDGAGLEVVTDAGSLREDGLVCYQEGPAGRREVAARYVPAGPDRYSIAFERLDPESPLVVDPVIGWSSFLGGALSPLGADDYGYGIAVDAGGNVYVSGYTYTVNFPVTGAFDPLASGSSDAFVTKVNAAGSTLAWSTYLGGNSSDASYDLAVDGSGNVYVTGYTSSTDFPTTAGAYDTIQTSTEAFVTKINASGASLAWSTFLGGGSSDYGYGIEVDGAGNVYVAGYTNSTTFPIVGGFDSVAGSTPDGFVAKLNPTGTGLVWSSYLGGNATDYVNGIAVDGSGNVYVTGYTYSSDFPTLGGFDTLLGGTPDAFVTMVNASGASIAWSTYLGGLSTDVGNAIAVDGSGNAYVTGYTTSTDFPTTLGAFDLSISGTDGFVTKIGSGGGLVWSTFLGGSSSDYGTGIAVDSASQVTVCGYTFSSTFPTTPGAYDISWAGSYDAFVTRLPANGSALAWSTFVGGVNSDYARALAIDASGNAYVTGNTFSTDYPAAGGFDTALGGSIDAFVTKVNSAGSGLGWSSYLGGTSTYGSDVAYALSVDGSGNAYLTGNTNSSDFPVTVGAFDTTLALSDVFVTRVNAGGTIAWSTFVGGLSDEYGRAIQTDASGNVYVTGYTYSSDFPVSSGFDTVAGSLPDGFVLKLNPAGSALVWSSFLGGNSSDYPQALAIDGAENVYVGGYTYSTDFPTAGGFDTVIQYTDGFVTKINASGASLAWSSYLGGSIDYDYVYGVAVDASGNVYATGYTYASDFPTTPGAFDTTWNGSYDAFVTKVNATGSSLGYSTFLGGTSSDYGYAIAVDGAGSAYVSGQTFSSGFPTTPGAYDTSYNSADAFVTKLNPTGSGLVWSTFLGGASTDYAYALGIDAANNVYVTGYTYSFDFPMVGAFDSTFGGVFDAFVTKIASSGAALAWSSYLGGVAQDYGYAISPEPSGAVYVGGYTYSTDFPTSGGFDPTLGGIYDAFVTRIENSNPDPPVGLGQFRLGGLIPIAIGAWTNQASIVVSATAGDSDGDLVRLQVEIAPIDVDFTGSGPFPESGLSLPGSQISFPVVLPAGPPPEFHWRVRTMDANGRTSAWVAFGGNSDALVADRDVAHDAEGPTTAIETPTPAGSYTTAGSPIALSGTATDASSGVTTVTWTTDRLVVPSSGTALGTDSWSIGSIALLPGVNVLTVTAQDAAGNSGSDVLVVTYDTAAPTVSIASPTPPYLTGSGTLPIAGTATDDFQVAGVTWVNSRGGSGTATLSGPATSPSWSASVPLSPGDNTITVTATDGAGNTATAQITEIYDNVPPTVSITTPTPPSSTTGNPTITLTGTASDANGIPAGGITWFNSANSASGTASGTTSWTTDSPTIPLEPGSNLITVTAADTVGNTASATITIYSDTLPPEVTITAPVTVPNGGSGAYTTGSSTVTLSGTAIDDIAVSSVSWNNVTAVANGTATLSGPPTSREWSTTSPVVPLVTGSNTINVVATDSVGRVSLTTTIVVNYDNNSPALVVSIPNTAASVTPTTPLAISGTATDDTNVTTLTVTNQTTGTSFPVTAAPGLPAASTSWSASVALVIGPNTVVVEAGDGGSTTTVTLTITLDPYGPAVTITGPTGGSTYVSGTPTIALSGVASDNRGVTQVDWARAGGGSGQAVLSGPSVSLSWSVASIPLALGTNDITITARDEAGNTSTDTLQVTYDTQAPGITIETPTTAPTYTTTAASVALGGSASDNVSIASVTWTNTRTGDTGTASGTANWSVASIPLLLGENVVTAIVTDAAGATRSDSITLYRDGASPTVTITSPTGGTTYSTTAATIGLGGTASDDTGVATVAWQSVAAGPPVVTRTGVASGTTSWSIASIPLDPGTNTITVTVTDGASQTATDTLTVSYDPTPPSIAITVPNGTGAYSTTTTPVTLGGTASDFAGLEEVSWVNASTGGSGTAAGLSPWSASVPLTSGANAITVTARDTAGNTASASITVTYDPAAPLVAITLPTTAISFTTGTSSITLGGTASDDVGVASVSWASDQAVSPNADVATGTTAWTASVPLVPGSNVISITATDGVGRTGTTRITIFYDASPPQVTVLNPTTEPAFSTTAAYVVLDGTATDNLQVQGVTWSNAATGGSGTAQGTATWSTSSIDLAEGVNVITITATDGVGNEGTTTVTVTYDGTLPTISITSPTNQPTWATSLRPILVGGPAGDNVEVVSVTWVNDRGGSGTAALSGPVTSPTWSASVYLFQGANVITATATDPLGNQATATITITFTAETEPPTAAIDGATPTTSSAVLFSFAGTATDNVGVVSVSWWNQTTRVRGAAALSGTGPWSWTAVVPLTAGANVIVITAADDAGNTGTDTITVTYTPPADGTPPAVTIVAPTGLDTYAAGASAMALTASATDNVGISSVFWVNAATGGDGVASPAAGTNWTTAVALYVGVNVITVTAADPLGNLASDTITVTFTPPPGDTSAPTVTITSHPTGTTLAWGASTIPLGGTASDNGTLTAVIWSNAATGQSGTADGLSPWTAQVGLAAGLNVITMTGYDASGNRSTDRIVVSYTPPPDPPEHVEGGHCGSFGLDLLWPLGIFWLSGRRRRRTLTR